MLLKLMLLVYPVLLMMCLGLKDSVKNGETGLLVESGNIQSLAEGVISLLEDQSKRQKLSLNALNYAKEFNWDKTANEFIAKIS